MNSLRRVLKRPRTVNRGRPGLKKGKHTPGEEERERLRGIKRKKMKRQQELA